MMPERQTSRKWKETDESKRRDTQNENKDDKARRGTRGVLSSRPHLLETGSRIEITKINET
jgi:hypothetical protein